MAVVSISRIQVRRGRKNQGSGLPQLASGEFGWAVDTQELYIGNGSVSEGAPYVGNTRVLTQNDNLFDYIGNYEYKSSNEFITTGPTADSPITRPIQERLDDNVSVKSFGATGNGSDQTVELQRAIDQLYLNPVTLDDVRARAILYVNPGEYVISSTLYIPPFVTLKGSGIDKTIFRMTGNGPAFKTISRKEGVSYVETPTLLNNQARNIEISDLTVTLDTNQGLYLSSCRDSIFKNIKIIGSWTSGTSIDENNYAIKLDSLNSVLSSKNNIFENIITQGTAYSVFSNFDIYDNIWNSCQFSTHGVGICFGLNMILGNIGKITGPTSNYVSNSIFKNIDQQAIYIVEGTKNKSFKNKFYSTGNAGGQSNNAQYAVIEYIPIGNTTQEDWFERTADLMYDNEYFLGVPYFPEIISPNINDDSFTHVLNITSSGSGIVNIPIKLLKLPANKTKMFEIDYVYISDSVDAKRVGNLTIITDPTNNVTNIVDDYDYLGNISYAENLVFSAQNFDDDANFSVDTVAVMMLNSTLNDDGKIYFRVTTKT